MADQQPGRQGPPKSDKALMAGYVGFVRRSLSFIVVQQQARLVLGRLQLLGDGAMEAARRRAVQAEVTAGRERRAQAVCLRQGRDIRRHGFGLLD